MSELGDIVGESSMRGEPGRDRPYTAEDKAKLIRGWRYRNTASNPKENPAKSENENHGMFVKKREYKKFGLPKDIKYLFTLEEARNFIGKNSNFKAHSRKKTVSVRKKEKPYYELEEKIYLSDVDVRVLRLEHLIMTTRAAAFEDICDEHITREHRKFLDGQNHAGSFDGWVAGDNPDADLDAKEGDFQKFKARYLRENKGIKKTIRTFHMARQAREEMKNYLAAMKRK